MVCIFLVEPWRKGPHFRIEGEACISDAMKMVEYSDGEMPSSIRHHSADLKIELVVGGLFVLVFMIESFVLRSDKTGLLYTVSFLNAR